MEMELGENRVMFKDWISTIPANSTVFMRFPHHLFNFYHGEFGCLAEMTLTAEDIIRGMNEAENPDEDVFSWLRDKAKVDSYIVMKNNSHSYEVWWEGEPCEDMGVED
jgi:hypothetical protein